jgi:class 3 adenylate cyclase
MSIRLKIIFVVLPLIVASVVLVGAASYFVAASSVTNVATQFLSFKAAELEKYADGQWTLLAENGYVGRADMEGAAHAAVESFARSIIRSPTEAILAFDGEANIVMSAVGSGVQAPSLSPEEKAAVLALANAKASGFSTMSLGSTQRVVQAFAFKPFAWEVLVTEARSSFYGRVEAMFKTTAELLAAACAVSILLLLLFTRVITRPMEEVVAVMKRIIDSNDLGERVPVEYNDEIGHLSQTFNVMLGELSRAYEQIKKFAFDAVVAQKREAKIRNVFQLYVPKDVIEQVFRNPESALVGDNRVVSILFSDIRSFTSISEKMAPDVLVEILNRYFAAMAEEIYGRGGRIDKYIGDAIMAIFGAPEKHEDDALRSVQAGLGMVKALEAFNEGQAREGSPPFHIGIGINYGVVTVGNIGCEKKMDYTVIGDMVNLASRLEGLTKIYHQPVLISESVHSRVKDSLPCRLIDTVAVKGKTTGIRIYTTRMALSAQEERLWRLSDEAMASFYSRDFSQALEGFKGVLALDPDDETARGFTSRSKDFLRNPPPPEWQGVEILKVKGNED